MVKEIQFEEVEGMWHFLFLIFLAFDGCGRWWLSLISPFHPIHFNPLGVEFFLPHFILKILLFLNKFQEVSKQEFWGNWQEIILRYLNNSCHVVCKQSRRYVQLMLFGDSVEWVLPECFSSKFNLPKLLGLGYWWGIWVVSTKL